MDESRPTRLRVPEDLNGLDPILWPHGTSRAPDGMLTLAGHRLSDLIEAYGSPLTIMDEEDFRSQARAFATEFAGWTVYYAGKAFLCRTVARWVDEEGLHLDVCSGGELAVALSAGFPADRVELHGNNKSIEELEDAIESGVSRIIVDCMEEIDRIETLAAARNTQVSVLVRVTTGVEAHTHEYIATSHEDQKFGFSLHSGQAWTALMACHDRPHLKLTGLHSHIGSQIFDVGGFQIAAARVMDLLARFRAATGDDLDEVNLGGGFGIAYTAQDSPMSPAQLHQALSHIIDEERRTHGLKPLRLSIEPGRAIVGRAGVAVYTVGSVKPVDIGEGSHRAYVAVDGGMSDNIRTALYHAEYSAVLANRVSSAPPMLSRVVGKHCESGDILVHDVYLPSDIGPADLIAVPASGAYARSLSSNYNHITRPAVVAVRPGQARAMLRRETLADLMALDVDAGPSPAPPIQA